MDAPSNIVQYFMGNKYMVVNLLSVCSHVCMHVCRPTFVDDRKYMSNCEYIAIVGVAVSRFDFWP